MPILTAKIFTNGRSQAVRLPSAFRFKGSEVYIRKDPTSGDVILSEKRPDWEGFFAVRDVSDADTADFLVDRRDAPPQEREPF
jgi:antitoxin VapB